MTVTMRAGQLVDGAFEIERVAGRGGMGTVYRARDVRHGELVALKVLHAETEAERFAREGDVLAQLEHPRIVRYVAHGRTDKGEPYLAMEWLEGVGLDALLRERRLSLDEALALARYVAEALDVAHRRGIVHRDLKPSNLFLERGAIDGVKLLDFGIARVLARRARPLTVTGSTLGTPGYMAPEQARGLPNVDARADVFALGVVLFRCLAGQMPFAGDDLVAVLVKLALEDAPRLSDVANDVPPAVDELVARMLAKPPADRHADGGELLADLDTIVREAEPRSADEITIKVGVPAALASGAPSLGSDEQRVLCVVLASGSDSSPTLPATTGSPSEQALRIAVDRYGGKLDVLADGSLLVTVAGSLGTSAPAIAAARCALTLRDALPGVPVAVAAGRGLASERVPVGDVIDRGVRLLAGSAGSADGAIRIDAELERLLHGRFDVVTTAEGTTLVRELDAGDAARMLLGRPTRCVGRERELALLEMSLAHCASEPQAAIVLVTAPPGAGKSRLRYELARRLASRSNDGAADDTPPYKVWIARGDPMSAGAPFEMIAQMVRRAAGVLEGEPLAVRHAKLHACVAQHVAASEVERVEVFLGELVGAPYLATDNVQLRAARQESMLMGDQMRRAFLDLLGAECEAGPTMLVLEDLHWGDLPTITLVDAAVRRLQDRPLFVLALARPDLFTLFPNLWSERGIQSIALSPLSRKSSERLVRDALGDRIEARTLESLVERAAGNPFYLEELVRAVAEGKGDALPVTVLAMVESRLEALDVADRRLLRAASVFGQVFWRGGVLALAGETSALDARLESLIDREVIGRRADSRFPGEQELVFRHALVRDAAYSTLTDADRALGHRLAGRWLDEAGVREAIVLAEHFERGEEPARAATAYLAAAEQALQANDISAAIERAERGVRSGAAGEELGAIRLLEAEAELWRGDNTAGLDRAREAMTLLPVGSERWCLAASHASAASGRLANDDELSRLSAALASLESRFTHGAIAVPYAIACARAAMSLLVLAQRDRAEPLFAVLDRLASGAVADDPLALAWIHRAGALRDYFAEDIGAYLTKSRAVAESFARAGDERLATLQWVNVGYGYMMVGAYADAERTLREVARDAERLALKIVTANALHNWGMALCQLGALEEARRTEAAAVQACRAQGDRRLEGGSRMYLAAILERSGDLAGAEREARAAVDLMEAIAPVRAQALAVLSRVKLAQNDAPAALSAACDAMVLLERGGAEAGEGIVRLSHIEALRATGDLEGARRALATACERLRVRAANIHDEALRDSFLRRVPENATTLALVI